MSSAAAPAQQIRLAELVASLSLGIDLGFGQPMEHVLRQCLIGLRLASLLGFEAHERATVYYTTLLVNVGCHTDSHEQAKWFGDDIAMRSHKYDYDFRTLRGRMSGMSLIGAGKTPLRRLRTVLDFATTGHHEVDGMVEQHARLTRDFARDLGLPADVLEALAASYEHWDGRGWPGEYAGVAIPIASRIAQLAEFVEVAHRTGGAARALSVAERAAGRQFDPSLVACLRRHTAEVLDDLPANDSWEAVISREPGLAVMLNEEQLDAALEATADFVDLKSPYMLGHSRSVAQLAARAAEWRRLPRGDVGALYRAGLVSGFGRLGVSNAIWDKQGPLGAGERERVRMFPYLTERMLQQSEALAPLGRIAGAQRERLDGSGYPRGLEGPAISGMARVLAAAEFYQTKRESRPHRASLSASEAAVALRAEAKTGKLDTVAVEAVLAVAGQQGTRRPEGPAGLTPREIEVLELMARGLSNRQIAARLVISPKTAGNHIEHIYAKIGARSRVESSIFAMKHGLIYDRTVRES